jgi:hypothetical protein
MDGPLSLSEYLRDPWLEAHTGRRHLGRALRREHAAIREYLASQPASWRELVASWADRLGPVREGARLFVFTIAGNDETLIEGCLTALLRDLETSRLCREAEITVVRNTRADEPKDETALRGHRWAGEHRAAVDAHVLEVEWPAECSSFLARSRKLAVDITLHRLLAAPPGASCYFLTEDTDVEWIENGRARAVVQTFDRDPRLDGLRGWHLRTVDLLEYLPLFLERATWRFAEHALSSPALRPERRRPYSFAWNRVVTAGWNVAFTLEAYVLAGGYTPHVELFEDMDLGQRVSVMRGKARDGEFVPCTSTIAWMPYEACSDGRRALSAILDDQDLYDEAPAIESFLAARRRARSWSLADARAFCRTAPSTVDQLERVLERRRGELEEIVPAETADGILHGARRSLGQPDGGVDVDVLLRRQAAFLEAARTVSAGTSSSASLSAALGRTAA